MFHGRNSFFHLMIFLVLLAPKIGRGSFSDVKILIGKALKTVAIKGMNINRKYGAAGSEKIFKGFNTLVFDCYQKSTKDDLLVSLNADRNLLKWKNDLYEGEFLLSSKKDKKSCDLIVRTPLEKYISLLLAKEMNPTWPLEALKAQAVAARTYAINKMIHNKEDSFHLENSEKNQVNGNIKDETTQTKNAASETAGEILLNYAGELQPIFFHAKCGGRTLLPSDVWGGKVKGYESVACPFCFKKGVESWKHTVPLDKFTKSLKSVYIKQFGKIPTQKKPLLAYPDKIYNRTGKIYHGGEAYEFSKPFLRTIIGRETIPSNNYTLTIQDDQVVIEGRGLGHGVGLCQLGVLELAQRGYNYREILSYYFPNHKIANLKETKYTRL